MSIQAMARVIESSQMTGPTYVVLVMIAHHESEDRGAFPSIDRLAMEARCSVRTVQESIGRAKKAGELEVRYRRGPNGTNIYRTLCGTRGAASLYDAEATVLRTPQQLHPADERRPPAPELKELGVSSAVGLASSDSDVEPKAPKASTRPTDRQVYLAKRLTETWGSNARLGLPALQKLNSAYGVDAVSSALGLLKEFPPAEAVRSAYAYVEAICKGEAA